MVMNRIITGVQCICAMSRGLGVRLCMGLVILFCSCWDWDKRSPPLCSVGWIINVVVGYINMVLQPMSINCPQSAIHFGAFCLLFEGGFQPKSQIRVIFALTLKQMALWWGGWIPYTWERFLDRDTRGNEQLLCGGEFAICNLSKRVC